MSSFATDLMARFLPVARGKPTMMDWQSRDHDRNADPDWQADWRRGHEIGLLIIGGLALVIARGLKMRRLDDCLPSRMTWKPERMPQSAPLLPLSYVRLSFPPSRTVSLAEYPRR